MNNNNIPMVIISLSELDSMRNKIAEYEKNKTLVKDKNLYYFELFETADELIKNLLESNKKLNIEINDLKESNSKLGKALYESENKSKKKFLWFK